MASERSYEAYKRQYQITAKRNLMHSEMYTKQQYDIMYRNVQGAGFHDPARSIALGQREVKNTIRSGIYNDVARSLIDETKIPKGMQDKEEIERRKALRSKLLNDMGISKISDIRQKLVQEKSKEIWDFLRKDLKWSEQDIDDYLSPHEEAAAAGSSGTVAAG